MFTITLWIGIVLGIICLTSLVTGDIIIKKSVRKYQNHLKDAKMLTVAAGSHSAQIPMEMETASVKYNGFVDSGHSLPTGKYNAYLVQGDSMQYGDIKTGDVVFSTKEFKLKELVVFPSIVIIKIDNAVEGRCHYKIRRAWKICSSDNLRENYKTVLGHIMESDEYKDLKKKANEIYKSDQQMIETFEKRYQAFLENASDSDTQIVISTTYDVDDNQIRFSKHDVSSIMGIVKYVANISQPVDGPDNCLI